MRADLWIAESLEDREPSVVQAARAALRSYAGKDLGPAPDASREEHEKAVAAWKDWWRSQGSK